jgi:membrane protein DedA with SNARE-associated domain
MDESSRLWHQPEPCFSGPDRAPNAGALNSLSAGRRPGVGPLPAGRSEDDHDLNNPPLQTGVSRPGGVVRCAALDHHILIAAGTAGHATAHARALGHGTRHADHARRTVKRDAYIHLPLLSRLRVHGRAIDYVALFLLAALSGLGVNGLGEAALIAAAVYAARHHAQLAPVVLIAAAGGFVGGLGGFLVGRHGGRALFTAPGPLARLRRGMLARSERAYLRYDTLAILITPAWAAGIHRARWWRFVPLNLASALIWAAALGLGAYYLGSRVATELSSEFGWIVGAGGLVLLALYVTRRVLQAPPRR